MHRKQMLGAAVGRLREMALGGAAPAELWSFLSLRSFGNFWNQFLYLEEAFQQPRLFAYSYPGTPMSSPKDAAWRKLIDGRQEAWRAHKLPELMRLRDYLAFMRFARDEDVVVVVCGAEPASGRWIGQAGVRCYGGRLPMLTSRAAPHDGLLAADPTDPRLMEILMRFEAPLSYEAYVHRLEAEGLQVSPESDGFIVRDGLRNRFIAGYRLHGVYDPKTDEPVWIQSRAERLRAALNRHLGSELVAFGPHDEWQFRNDEKIVGPLWGPQPPAIEFSPDQEIRNLLTTEDLTRRFRYRNVERWNEMYPQHQIEKSS